MKLFEMRKRWLSLLLLLLLLGGSYSVYSYVRARSNLNKVRTLQQEMASQGSTWTPEQRREKGEQLRAAMAKLNSSQRSGLAEEGRQRFEQDLRSYHAMTPQAKVQYLDQQIRRSEERRRQMGATQPEISRAVRRCRSTREADLPGVIRLAKREARGVAPHHPKNERNAARNDSTARHRSSAP